MKTVGLQADAFSYTAAIDACSKGAQHETAIRLLSEMKAVRLKPTEISYTAAIDACSKAGQHEIAIKLQSEMKSLGLQPDVTSYTAVIHACKNTGNWQLVLGLIKQMKADVIIPEICTYTAAIDALQAGEQHHAADVLYAEVLSRRLRQQWSTHVPDKGMLDFHAYTASMTRAAMRLVLRDMRSYDTKSNSKHYIHNPTTDLVIITGHASSRGNVDGSILQPYIMDYCKKQGIVCTISRIYKGRLIITAAQLQQYTARQQQHDATITTARNT
jgi:pentatricopeptide repeat protein